MDHPMVGRDARIDGATYRILAVREDGVAVCEKYVLRDGVTAAEAGAAEVAANAAGVAYDWTQHWVAVDAGAPMRTVLCHAAELQVAAGEDYGLLVEAELFQKLAARAITPEWAATRKAELLAKYEGDPSSFLYLPGRHVGRQPNLGVGISQS